MSVGKFNVRCMIWFADLLDLIIELNTVFILSENVQDQGQIIGCILPFLEPAENIIQLEPFQSACHP